MSTAEIKSKLIEKIENTDDREFLEDLQFLFEEKSNDLAPIKLTPKQFDEIDEAIKEIERGEFLTNEEFEKKMDEWQKK